MTLAIELGLGLAAMFFTAWLFAFLTVVGAVALPFVILAAATRWAWKGDPR